MTCSRLEISRCTLVFPMEGTLGSSIGTSLEITEERLERQFPELPCLSRKFPSFGVDVSVLFALGLINPPMKWALFSFLVAEGQNLRYCGIGTGFDDVIITGNLDELKVCIGLRANRNCPSFLHHSTVHRILREGRRHCRHRCVSNFQPFSKK